MRKYCRKCEAETARNTRGDCKVCQSKYVAGKRVLVSNSPDRPPTQAERVRRWMLYNPQSTHTKAVAWVKAHPLKTKTVTIPEPLMTFAAFHPTREQREVLHHRLASGASEFRIVLGADVRYFQPTFVEGHFHLPLPPPLDHIDMGRWDGMNYTLCDTGIVLFVRVGTGPTEYWILQAPITSPATPKPPPEPTWSDWNTEHDPDLEPTMSDI